MANPTTTEPQGDAVLPQPEAERKGCMFYGGLVLLILALIIGGYIWYVKRQVNANPFTPTELTVEEEQTLHRKMEDIGIRPVEARGQVSVELRATPRENSGQVPAGTQPPIRISEKEINGLIASTDPQLAELLKISFERDLIVAHLNYPIPEDAEVWAGRTIRCKASVRITLRGKDLDIRVHEVRIAGFSVPGVWIKELKDQNLALEIFGDEEALNTFVSGLAKFELTPGELVLILRQ